jgi:hypothetical protein
MKKLLILLAITVVACTKPENSNDSEFSTNELNLSPAENSVNRAAALGSEENPIVVDKDAFIENVEYTLPVCDDGRLKTGTKEGERLSVRVYEAEFEAYNSFSYNKTTKCLTESPYGKGSSDFEIYNPRLYYKIFGEVVRLSVRDQIFNANTFWYKNAPGNQIQKVNFFNGGVTSIENPIPNPFNDNIDCKGLKEVDVNKDREGTSLTEGTLIVARGTQNVYEVSILFYETRFYIFKGFCGSGTLEPGVCNGIPAWVFGKKYVAGDKVVFSNTLYTKLARGWEKGPKCN